MFCNMLVHLGWIGSKSAGVFLFLLLYSMHDGHEINDIGAGALGAS